MRLFIGAALDETFLSKKELHIFITRILNISTKVQFVRFNHQMCMITFHFSNTWH